jgi:hypothetical protein
MLALSTQVKGSNRLMLEPTTVAGQRRGPRARLLLVAVLVLAFTGATASSAWATLEIQSYNDPAGSQTVHTYSLLVDGQPAPGTNDATHKNPFTLLENEAKSFGPPAGTYTWKATPAAGWKVNAINCVRVDPATHAVLPTRAGEFTVDVANGQVTIIHLKDEDEYCAFTNGKVSGGSGGGSGPGITPTLPGGGTSGASAAKGPALLRVTGGKLFASLKVSLGRQSVIKAQLLKSKKVVGTARVTHKAGTYTVKVFLKDKYRRAYRNKGLKKVTLTLKITVVGSNRATKVFRSGVVVRLT